MKLYYLDIDEYCWEHRISQAELSRKLGIREQTLSKFKEPKKRGPTISSLQLLLDNTDWPAEKWIKVVDAESHEPEPQPVLTS